MIYLIDGHNLIGKMPDISLSDIDDEEKLIRRIQDWARLDSRRRVMLFFDGGAFGGGVTPLTGFNVGVHFARGRQKADDLLIRQLKKLRNPQAYTLVTSDREILAAARKRKVGYVLSEEFVSLLQAEQADLRAEVADPVIDDPGEEEGVELSQQELDHWLSIFPEPPPSKTSPARKKPAAKASPQKPVQKPLESASLPASENPQGLSESDLAEWLAVFGDVPATGSPPPAQKPTAPNPRRKGKAPSQEKIRTVGEQATAGEKLNPAEIDEWLELFKKVDKK